MWWKRLFRQRPKDAEITEEIHSHLRMAIQDRIGRGESPRQARGSALRELGNAGLVKEDTRAVWAWVTVERLARDLKYALRQVRHSPGFTALAVRVGATPARREALRHVATSTEIATANQVPIEAGAPIKRISSASLHSCPPPSRRSHSFARREARKT